MRWSFVVVTPALGVAGLLVAACNGDSPTATSNINAPPIQFSVTPASYAAARAVTAHDQKTKMFATIPILEGKTSGQGSRISQNLVNSPWDLTYNGGPVVTKATQWNIYVNCKTTSSGCWGTGTLTPRTFLQDLDQSSLIDVAAQYLHEDPTGRYGPVNEMQVSVSIPVNGITGVPTASNSDIWAILHAASLVTTKSGYQAIYHVFLPQGVDMCTGPAICYSPDDPYFFQFCAFHGSVDFGPHWHVLYTLEPYQFVPGCVLPQQSRVIDGTASTLSHEFTELITDPDLDAWYNDLTGNEIGDLCFTFRNPESIFDNTYVVQEEYSNTVHACTDGAF